MTKRDVADRIYMLSELTDQIYDTLLGNVGMSEYHVALDINEITNQVCDLVRDEIYIEMGSKTFKIKVTEETNFEWLE